MSVHRVRGRRGLHRLTATEVRALSPGWHFDGGSLYGFECRALRAKGLDPRVERDAAPGLILEKQIARKTLTFLEQNTDPACYLYRHIIRTAPPCW